MFSAIVLLFAAYLLGNLTTRPRLIGTSLSFCVKDIARGKVGIGDVWKIVAGTYVTDGDWEEVLESYAQIYWYDFPDEAVAIARRLITTGRIEQPRVINGDTRHPLVFDDHWITDESQIRWSDEEYDED